MSGTCYGSCRENCPGIEEGILLPKLQTILYIFLHMFLFVGVKLQCQEIFWPKLIGYIHSIRPPWKLLRIWYSFQTMLLIQRQIGLNDEKLQKARDTVPSNVKNCIIELYIFCINPFFTSSRFAWYSFYYQLQYFQMWALSLFFALSRWFQVDNSAPPWTIAE